MGWPVGSTSFSSVRRNIDACGDGGCDGGGGIKRKNVSTTCYPMRGETSDATRPLLAESKFIVGANPSDRDGSDW